ncbi:MAG TPA: ATP synthase F1 subunit delta [Solirubrobacteraceae bacterium]|jgi:F-type H+-transporting ATPase subunit delta|nr:ATP synthase F1 subunit delta [Solirubrobacteraceae bacterium]
MEEIGQVYSRALFQAAEEHDKLDAVREQLGAFADALDSNRELAVFFFSPYFSTEEKKEGLGRVLDGAEDIVRNFLELLVEKHRMPAIHRIRREYESLWEEANRLLPVEVTSAIELDPETVEQIGDAIRERTGRRVQLESSVDPDILGGIVVRVGDRILDASIANRLEGLRKQVARS